MSVIQSIKNIYNGPFTQYLKASEKIGGAVHEQSRIVDVLFLLEINFLSIIKKYKKPVHEQEQNIFIEPISIQIRRVKRVKDNNTSSPHITHLSLINETAKIFELVKQPNVDEFIQQIKTNVTPHLSKLKNDLLKLDIKHVHWVYFANVWLDSMLKHFADFYKDGIAWEGTEDLPMYLMGDISEIYRKIDHLKLFQEINQGENITRMLRHIDRQIIHDEEEEEEEE